MSQDGNWATWDSLSFGRKVRETTNGVHVGALVSIAEKATLWNGTKCDRWYWLKKWYVTELNGNKATLGKDESGKYSMRVPISTNFLTVVRPSNTLMEDDNGQI